MSDLELFDVYQNLVDDFVCAARFGQLCHMEKWIDDGAFMCRCAIDLAKEEADIFLQYHVVQYLMNLDTSQLAPCTEQCKQLWGIDVKS